MTLDLKRYSQGATGDVMYRSASGLWLPIGGTRGAGNVITDQAGGVPIWAAPSGGGGGGGGVTGWNPDALPGTPNALDLECNNNTASAWPGGWTAWATGDLENQVWPNVEPGQLSTLHSSGAAWKGRYATIPAGDFNFAIRVGSFGTANAFGLLGIGIGGNAGTNLGQAYSIYRGTHTSVVGHGVVVDSNNGVANAFSYAGSEFTTLILRRVGTAVTAGWTIDGRRAVEVTSVTLGFTATHLWVRAFGNQAQNVETLKWLRVDTSTGAKRLWGAWV